jgi:hypothetical protein
MVEVTVTVTIAATATAAVVAAQSSQQPKKIGCPEKRQKKLFSGHLRSVAQSIRARVAIKSIATST